MSITTISVVSQEIRPCPEDLIQCWEDYSFMGVYDQIYHDSALKHKPLVPSLPDKISTGPLLHQCRELFSRSPQTLHLFQVRQLISYRLVLLFDIRTLLNLSWDEMRVAICWMPSILGEEPEKIHQFLVVLPTILCSELSGTTSLAPATLHLIRRIGTGDLPMHVW